MQISNNKTIKSIIISIPKAKPNPLTQTTKLKSIIFNKKSKSIQKSFKF